MSRFRRGFTVVEILSVIGIIVVLTGLIALAVGPSVGKAKTEPVCAGNLRHIATALNLYVADSDGVFPPRTLLGDGGVLASYHLSDRCPLGAIGYDEAYGSAVSKAKWAKDIGLKPTLEDPAGRSIPEFDPSRDVLVRCLSHGYDGFNALKGTAWNRSDPQSKGRLLAVRYDTSVVKAPVVSCWELRYLPRRQIPFLRSWQACDRPSVGVF